MKIQVVLPDKVIQILTRFSYKNFIKLSDFIIENSYCLCKVCFFFRRASRARNVTNNCLINARRRREKNWISRCFWSVFQPKILKMRSQFPKIFPSGGFISDQKFPNVFPGVLLVTKKSPNVSTGGFNEGGV